MHTFTLALLCSGVTGVRREPQLLPEVWEAEAGVSAEEREHAEDAVLTRTERLSRRTRTQPRDVAAWLQYVRHQEDVLSVSHKRAL